MRSNPDGSFDLDISAQSIDEASTDEFTNVPADVIESMFDIVREMLGPYLTGSRYL